MAGRVFFTGTGDLSDGEGEDRGEKGRGVMIDGLERAWRRGILVTGRGLTSGPPGAPACKVRASDGRLLLRIDISGDVATILSHAFDPFCSASGNT